MEVIVGGIGHEDTEAGSEGEEDLGGGILPDTGLLQLLQIRPEVVLDAHFRAGESHSPNEEDKQHHVREEGREPDDLGGEGIARGRGVTLPFHSCRCPSRGRSNKLNRLFPDRSEQSSISPRDKTTHSNVPVDLAQVIQSLSHVGGVVSRRVESQKPFTEIRTI